jgi:hypothetical protein
MNTIIAWFSCGATSAVACKLAIDKYGEDNVRIIYFKIDSAHEDNDRFIKDCENWYGKEIEIFRSRKYLDQFDVIKKTKYVNGAKGARCTLELKRKVRQEVQEIIEYENQIFGFEHNKKEIIRANRLLEQNPETKALFPLIEARLTKENCLGLLIKAGIELPVMYKLGYPNNNCIGCVKGGIGYWNKIRIDFPKHFERMAKLEREVGRSCLKDDNGRIFLDELDEARGRKQEILVPDCGFFCGDDNEYI